MGSLNLVHLKMQSLKILPLLLLSFTTLYSQSTKQKLRHLQQENDSLRLELLKCQTGPFQRLTESLESPKFGENPIFSRSELREKLLPQIKAKSAEKYTVAENTIAATDRFLEYCELIKTDLVQRSDSSKGQSLGVRDTKTSTQYFIEEKRGAEFKAKIDALRALYLQSIQNDPYFTPRIVLEAEKLPDESHAKTWEVYKFMGMPIAAVFPMIGKIKSDAKGSEAAVLQYLNK
jgi:hypothetical protein